MFEYKIHRPNGTVTLSPKEINDILTMNVAREALINRLMGSCARATEELTVLCRQLYKMTPMGIIDNNKLIQRIITLSGNGTHPQNDIWFNSAEKALNDRAICTYNNSINRMTLFAMSGSDKKLSDKRAKLAGLLEKFAPEGTDIKVVSYNISPSLTLYGLVNQPFAEALENDLGWKDTRENWLADMLAANNDKPVVLHMHGGEIYIIREHAAENAAA